MYTEYNNGWSTIIYRDGSIDLRKDNKSLYLQGDDALELCNEIDNYPHETAKYGIEQLVFENYLDVMG